METVDCLCRKYLIPDLKPHFFFFFCTEVLNWICASATIIKHELLLGSYF